MSLFDLSTSGIEEREPTPSDLPDQPQPKTRFTRASFDAVFDAAASEYGVDADVLRAMAYAESRFNPDAVSPKGAIGVMQFMPATAKQFGINPRDPVESIFGGAAYLAQILEQHGGDYEKAVAGYNWGPHRKQFSQPDWMTKAPAETQNYVKSVLDMTDAIKGGQYGDALPQGVAQSNAGAGRGFVNPVGVNDQVLVSQTPAATKPKREPVPDMTVGSVAQDALASALAVGPTALKGVGELASLATGGRIGQDFAKGMQQRIDTVTDMVGSERGAAQKRNFQADMADDSVGLGEALLNNKGALLDAALPSLGSMILPVGAAGVAGKAATIGKAAQALDKAALAARVASVQQLAGIGATAAQNAASTFAELVDKGVPMADAYKAAGITVPFSLIAGKLTGGGAEGALIKGASGATVAKGAGELGKAFLKEGVQEGGESAGQVAGEVFGADQKVSPQSAIKRVGTEAVLGAVLGGGINAAQQVAAPKVEDMPTVPTAPDVPQKGTESILQREGLTKAIADLESQIDGTQNAQTTEAIQAESRAQEAGIEAPAGGATTPDARAGEAGDGAVQTTRVDQNERSVIPQVTDPRSRLADEIKAIKGRKSDTVQPATDAMPAPGSVTQNVPPSIPQPGLADAIIANAKQIAEKHNDLMDEAQYPDQVLERISANPQSGPELLDAVRSEQKRRQAAINKRMAAAEAGRAQALSGESVDFPDSQGPRPLSVERGLEIAAASRTRALLPQEKGYMDALRKEIGPEAFDLVQRQGTRPFLVRADERKFTLPRLIEQNNAAMAKWDAEVQKAKQPVEPPVQATAPAEQATAPAVQSQPRVTFNLPKMAKKVGTTVAQDGQPTAPKMTAKQKAQLPQVEAGELKGQEVDSYRKLTELAAMGRTFKPVIHTDAAPTKVTGIPAYSGNKASFVQKAGGRLISWLKNAKGEVLYDAFGGGGGYGLWVVNNAAKDVKHLVINEIDQLRSEKLQWTMENNGKLAELYKSPTLKPVIDLMRQLEGGGSVVKAASENARAGELLNNPNAEKAATNAPIYKKLVELGKRLTHEDKIALQAIIDRAYASRGSHEGVDSIISKAVGDSVEYHRQALAFTQRGGTVHFTVHDGTDSSKVPTGAIVISDPPYLYTTGYKDSGDQTMDYIEGPEFFEKTKQMLLEAEKRGNTVIYHNSLAALAGMKAGETFGAKSSKADTEGVAPLLDEFLPFKRSSKAKVEDDFVGVKHGKFAEGTAGSRSSGAWARDVGARTARIGPVAGDRAGQSGASVQATDRTGPGSGTGTAGQSNAGLKLSRAGSKESRHAALLKEWMRGMGADYVVERATRHSKDTRGIDYELRDVPVGDITPSQTGEDYDNASSRYTAKQIATKSLEDIHRKEDVLPIVLDEGMNIVDGNHRHFASTQNGEATIPALVPVRKGSGKVLNAEQYAQGIKASRAPRNLNQDITLSIPVEGGGTAKLTVNAEQYIQSLDEREEAPADDIQNVEVTEPVKPSKSTPARYQTQTPEFKRWFGDSKVVDSEGKPLVVYHGTTGNITKFDGERSIEKDAGWYGRGIYFTADPATASAYTGFDELQGRESKGNANVMPVYVTLKNPYIWPKNRAAATTQKEANDIRNALEAAGHDGVIVPNEYAEPAYARHYEVIAFRPEQIKSATGNSGAFDPANPDITKSVTKALRKPSFTVAQARAAISKRHGKIMQGLEGKGLVTLAQTEEEAITAAAQARADKTGEDVESIKRSMMGAVKNSEASPIDIKYSADGRIQGFYDPETKRSFLVADALNEKTASGVLMHEVGIHMAADGSMDSLFNRAQQLLKIGKGDPFFDKVRQRMRDAGETSAEEAAAYIVEEYINNEEAIPSSVMDWMTSLYASIRAWMYRHGIIITSESLTAADIAAVATANAKRMAEDGEAAGSGFDMLSSVSESPEQQALRTLSESDDLFSLPKSDKKNMAGIIADNDPRITFKESSFGNETLYNLKLPGTAGTAKIWVRKPNPYGPSTYSAELVDGELTNITTERPGENPDDVSPDVEDVYIDVSDLREGDYGNRVYNIAATYAHNTGRIFIGDPSGLSDIAMRRRVENMISTAIKFGTTDHIAPHPKQVAGNAEIGVPPLKWVYGDTIGNIKRMIDVSLESSKNAGSEDVNYEPGSQNFTLTAPGGEVLAGEPGASAERLPSVSGSPRKGWRTAARRAIFSALLRESGESRSGKGGRDGLLERLVSLRNQRNDTTGSIFYSRGSSSPLPGGNALSRWEMPESGIKDAFTQKWVDARIDLKRAQQAIEGFTKQGIPEMADAQLASTLYAGRVSDRSHTFINREVKPLMELMHKQGVDQLALSDYMLARHAPERNAQIAKVNPDMPDGGAGTNSKGVLMTTQAANDYIANLSAGERAKLALIAARVDAITKGTRDLLVDEGLESKDAIAAWEGAYKHYAPLFKDEAETGLYSHPQGSGFTVKGSASKRAMGSEGEVTNMLAHVFQQREAALTRAEKNRVAQSLYALALSNPNPDFFSVVRPNMKEAAIEAELQSMGVDPATFGNMERAPTIQVIDKSTGQVRKQVNPRYKELPNAIVLKVDGQDRVVMFNTKNEQAMRLVTDLKNLDAVSFDWINKLGHVTRLMASMATQYNPAFGVVNVVRDVQGALVNLSSTPIANKRLKVLKNVASAGAGIAADLTQGDNAQGEWSKLYRQYREDGGQTGYMDNIRDPFERTKAIAKELENLDRSKAHPARVAQLVLGALNGYNTTLENAVRLSAYKAALDEGVSRAKAAKIARELTVDFNRKGANMRHAAPMYAFANAAVQGTARTLETLADPKRAALIVSGGLAIGALQALALAAAGYDDDEIPEFEKARSLIIPMGVDSEGKKQFFKLPLPLGLHILPNTGRIATELYLSGGKDAGKKVWGGMGQIAGAFNPLGGGDITTAHGVASTIAPTVLDPLVDLAMNKNFAGNSISNERRGEEDMRPGFRMGRENTLKQPVSEIYTGIAEAMNAATGGNDYRKGKASPTPEQVRHAIMAVGGGLLREIEKGTNSIIRSSKGEDVKTKDVPAVGRFYGDIDPNDVQQSRFYDSRNKVQALASELKQLKKGKNSEGSTALRNEQPLASLVSREAKVSRDISEINREIIDNIDNAERVKSLEQRRIRLMKSFNEAVARAEKQR